MRRSFLLALLACGLLLAALTPVARAAGSPDISLQYDAPTAVLFGEDAAVTLRATNPVGQRTGYNLSFRVVLPAGVSYVPGSASIAPLQIADAPGAGETTLIFENVSDSSPASSYALGFQVRHDTGSFTIGDRYASDAGAYINDDPRFVPDFAADGTASGDFTGSATASATTQINAIEIEKDEPSPEGELLRGAHDHQTVYTLTVRNNAIQPTTSLQVEDWLPAGLEYLGCGTADNTTDAPTNPLVSVEEYAGSGPLNPGNAPAAPDCVAPSLVETLLADPDGAGPMPNAVYTHVVWSGVGNVAARGELRLQYVAAVPLRENTLTWPGGLPPTAASGRQGSNLDNNSGPETQDEQALTNYATASGTFDGTLPVSDADTLTRTAEDLRVLKSVDLATINQGQISRWSLQIDTSEYRFVDDVVVNDTLPDGLCPLGPVDYEDGSDDSAECDPTGDLPSAPYTLVAEQADGSYLIRWDASTVPQLARMQPSTSFTIAFPTRTRAAYQEGFRDAGPVLARDTWSNAVDVEGADFRICAPADPDCTGGGAKIDGDEPDGGLDLDSSSARQEAGGLTLDKTVRTALPTPVDCDTGSYVDGPAPRYGPGDRVCWQLRIDFASLLDSGDPVLTDFLPEGVTYVPGSARATASNTVGATLRDEDAADGILRWDLGGDVPSGALTFEWRFATDVDQTAADAAGDLVGNLMKLSFENTAGTSFPLRDEVDFARSQALLDLVKGVRDVNDAPGGGNPPDTDGATVAAGDVVTFRIDLTNDGDLDAQDAVVWDELEDGIACADVRAVSDGGSCTGTRITWSGVDVAAAATRTLTYDVTMPAGIEPGRRFDDDAGVVSYTSDTNTGGTFTYVPEDNIDPGAPPANAPAADDPSYVQTRAVTLAKTRTTQVAETGNDATTQATIGELIDYTVTLTIPEGTTVYGSASLVDFLDGEHGEMTGFPDARLNGGALPPGVNVGGDMTSWGLQFPSSYTNAAGSGDDVFTVTFSAPVADVAGNSRVAPNETVTNSATFRWQNADTTPQSLRASVDTTIVEPNVAVAKDEDDADDRVEPGQTITYTVSVTNPSGTRVSTAHDLSVVDHVPLGLTPVVPSISDAGIWDSGARTITWTIPSIAPGAAAVRRTYQVTVDDPATAGSRFQNTVDVTATSLAGAVTGERGPGSPIEAGYVATARDTVQLGEATLTKSVAPGRATVGERVVYTTDVTFPAGVTYFDATVLDTLPDGLIYDGTIDVTCAGGPCTPAPTTLAPEPQPDGTTRLAWFLDDLSSDPAARTYTITYAAIVADRYVPEATLVSDGQRLTNTAQARYDGSDRLGTPTSVPDPSAFSNGSTPDTADVTVIEPRLTLDKDVSGDGDDDDVRTTQPGDGYTYSLTVRNTGTAPAYDAELTDALDARRLVNVVPLANPAATVTDGDATDGTLAWTIPGPIAPGAAVTLQYTADLAPSAQLRDGDAVLNTADVPAYWGVSEADRTAEPARTYRAYDDVPPDTVRLDVDLPALAVDKTTGAPGFPDSAVAEVGEPFSWLIRVTNTAGLATARAVDVEDVLPANWTYVAGSASFAPGGTVEPTVAPAAGGDRLTWSGVGDLAPGDSLVLTFQARPTADAIADPGTGAGSPNVNAATATAVDASGAGASGDGPYADDDEAQAILELPVLAVTKTPDGDTVAAGDDARYAIVVRNDGDVPTRDVLVDDVLGAGQSYRAGDASATPSSGFSELSVVPGPGADETSVSWAIEEIPARSSVTITVPIGTDPSLADATLLANGVTVTSREITTPVRDDGSYRTSVSADVGIVKTAPAGPVDAGDEGDWDLTVVNDGPSDATGVLVEDTLPPNLAFVSADAPCAEAGGVVRCAIGRLAAGTSVRLRLRLSIDPNETVEVENTATVTTTSPDPNPANDSSTARKTVGVDADVAVAKDGPSLPVLQGTSFDYAIDVENVGASAATDVRLSDPLPAGVAFDAVRTTAGSCGEIGGTIECSFGTLQPDDEVEVTVTVRAVDVGTPVNTAVVTTTATETTTANNDDDATVTIVPAADLGVTKTAPPAVDPDGQIAYALGVRNNGPSDATGVTLTDTLPAGVEFLSADPGCAHAAGVVTCAVGALAVGDSRSYAVTVTAPHALGGQTLVNSVVVDGNEGDLVVANDTAQASTRVGDSADLTLSKTSGGAIAGEDASWTIVVRNDGPSTATPVTVTDQLPTGATPTAATPSQGGCAIDGQDVVCGLGNLPSGGAAQINVIADVAPSMAGQPLRNHATVTSPQSDPVSSNDEDAVTTIVAVPSASGPDLVLTKTASTKRPRLGVPFRYDVIVRNVGGEPARRVRVLDTLSRALDVRSVRASSGRCTRDGGRIACSLGTLAPGANATIALTVVPTETGRVRNTASAAVREGADVNPANNADGVDVRVRAPRASWTLAKRADRGAVRGGDTVSFALTLRVGTRAVAGAQVCDRLPDGLAFVRVPGARFRDGRACWSFDYLAPHARRTLRVTARADRAFVVRRVRNQATAAARNAPRRTAAARVRIDPAFGAAGGVTG